MKLVVFGFLFGEMCLYECLRKRFKTDASAAGAGLAAVRRAGRLVAIRNPVKAHGTAYALLLHSPHPNVLPLYHHCLFMYVLAHQFCCFVGMPICICVRIHVCVCLACTCM